MKIGALVEDLEHVCYRYRIRPFAAAIEHAGARLEAVPLRRGPAPRAFQLYGTRRYDTVLLQRRLLPEWQLALLRHRARRLVFDFDDAVLYRDSYHTRGHVSDRNARRFEATVRSADLVIAGNRYLAECAAKSGAPLPRVTVIPTCVEPARYAPARHEGRGPRLVWIGSASTLQGLERRKDLWTGLGRAIPGLTLHVICDRFPAALGIPVVETPWSERTEAQQLAAGDVGVSVVPDDPWSLGKCGLKVLQYQAAGLPVVANPVGIHKELVEPGVTGFLPSTPAEWVDAVRTLVEDPALRARMGRAARTSVESRYAIAGWAPAFVSAVCGTFPSAT